MAPPPPLVALNAATVAFGGVALFEALSIGLSRGERACLVGRNGSGKSTLLKLLAGLIEPDAGERFVQPGTTVAYLAQDPLPPPGETVAGYVAAGLRETRGEDAPARHRVDAVLARVGLEGKRALGTLSGGEGRRAALARALVGDPDVLLLDEPTNHLDLPTIEWLEEELLRFKGALLIVSHDRAFLNRLSNATLWLDRGQLRRLDEGFAQFEAWAEALRAREDQALHKLDRKIVREERWRHRGITARRKRNQGRLTRLEELRRQRAEWLRRPGPAKLAAAATGRQSNLVIEAESIGKAFAKADGTERVVLADFSTRIRRGDRIGIIGPNGAGKTTLVRLLIGDLAPDRGSLRLGAGVSPLYFDQRRESLDPEATLWQTLVPGGGDSLMVRGRQRHVVAYLRDFLFDEGQARQPVKSLSGGERNRLLLACLFARPSDLLVLDEPTNDLDLETLDLLVETLDDYPGTLILVSHDRDVLDRLATGIIAIEAGGRAIEYAGGYSDTLAQQRGRAETGPRDAAAQATRKAPAARAKRAARKLGYKEQRELARLPGEIERLEIDLAALEDKLADPELYERDPEAFEATAARLEAARARLSAAETRWLELEARREQLAAAPEGGA
ncbi:MAG: ATP-binding cassette domain-containing protein [Proteobacteria bacterium]|nr:ATP-binding cassette domain-containing protein [Pseudomonadota bacterium]